MQAIFLCGVAAATAGAAAGDPNDVTVAWRGAEVAPAALAEHAAEIGASPAAAVAAWAPFAAERGYALHLTDDGRVLYLAPAKRESAKRGSAKRGPAQRDLGLVAKTTALFDELLPASGAGLVTPQTGGAPEAGRGRGKQDEDGSWSVTWSWGAGPWRRDAETAVLVAARDARDYGAALESLAERHEHLRGWVGAARASAGCTLESPLVAVWLLADAGLEEYRPENELVHRLATLLVQRRFDHQPPWMLQGLAWHFEDALLKSIYCFPGRNEFVAATEHTGWEVRLKNDHKQTDELACADVIALEPGRFDAAAARNAFGAVGFLVRHHGDALPQLCEDLRLVREEKGVDREADGTWKRIPGYEPAAEDVLPLLQKAAGEDVLAELMAFYRKGKGYRSPR